MEEALKDERFRHILKDPRFRKIPRNVRKVKVDKRFTDMFSSREFNEKSKLDERGRALNLTSVENLKKLYNVTNDSSEDEALVDQKETSDHKSPKNRNKSKNIVPDDSPESFKQANKTKRNKKNKRKDGLCDEFDASEEECQSDDGNDVKPTSKEIKSNIFKKNNDKNSDERAKVFKKDRHGQVDEADPNQKSENRANSSKRTSKKQLKKNKIADVIPKSSNQIIKQAKTAKKALVSDTNESDASEEECQSDDGNDVKPTSKEIKANIFKRNNDKNSDERAKVFKKDRRGQVDEADSEESQESEAESDDSSSDESSSHKEEFDHHWEELHEEAEDTDEITRRLAVCNMDWDRIRADDLFVVFHSFKPADSSIHSVKIYPSEFGLQRMEEEKLKGPPELVEKTLDGEEVENKNGSKYHREKLRQYQIKRLRYYYAVVECDTPETANHLYDGLNGIEYESSSARFDLRFIPDDTTFDQEPTSVTEKAPDPTEYKPRLFVTTALQQVKVNLTWDETDPHRREIFQRAFTDPDSVESEIREYLASTSGESEVEEQAEEKSFKPSTVERIAKYKALLQSLEEKDKKKEEEKYDMEITWDPSLKEKAEEIVQKKLEDTSNPFDEMLKKKKEKRKLKKQGKKGDASVEDENSSASEERDSDFISDEKSSEQPLKQDTKRIDELYLISDAKKIDKPQEKSKSKRRKHKKEKKGAKVDEFQCDVLDPRFSAIYSSHDYNIDPSDPHCKKTNGTLAFIQEKQKRLLKNKDIPVTEERKTKKMRYA